MPMYSCPLCTSRAKVLFSAEVLGAYLGKYALCDECGLLFAHQPTWLTEAYRDPIAQMDTGIVRRNLYNTLRFTVILTFLFDKRSRFLDYAGGSGMFTRLMRDSGFDFHWHDKYCENQLAAGFERQDGSSYSTVTALEVLEHVPDPQLFVETLINQTACDNIIFSTSIFKEKAPPKNWHYYAFESGQHICFYQLRTLEYLAKTVGMQYVNAGNLHLFTRKPCSPYRFKILASRWGLLAYPFARVLLSSRTQSDLLSRRSQTRSR